MWQVQLSRRKQFKWIKFLYAQCSTLSLYAQIMLMQIKFIQYKKIIHLLFGILFLFQRSINGQETAKKVRDKKCYGILRKITIASRAHHESARKSFVLTFQFNFFLLFALLLAHSRILSIFAFLSYSCLKMLEVVWDLSWNNLTPKRRIFDECWVNLST